MALWFCCTLLENSLLTMVYFNTSLLVKLNPRPQRNGLRCAMDSQLGQCQLPASLPRLPRLPRLLHPAHRQAQQGGSRLYSQAGFSGAYI